jgi:hypothetical protein
MSQTKSHEILGHDLLLFLNHALWYSAENLPDSQAFGPFFQLPIATGRPLRFDSEGSIGPHQVGLRNIVCRVGSWFVRWLSLRRWTSNRCVPAKSSVDDIITALWIFCGLPAWFSTVSHVYISSLENSLTTMLKQRLNTSNIYLNLVSPSRPVEDKSCLAIWTIGWFAKKIMNAHYPE